VSLHDCAVHIKRKGKIIFNHFKAYAIIDVLKRKAKKKRRRCRRRRRRRRRRKY
jgi:predicted flavoprotein YhiN